MDTFGKGAHPVADEEEVVVADAQELGTVLGCSEDLLADMRDIGVLEPFGEAWNVAPAREYLRDAAWADQAWY